MKRNLALLFLGAMIMGLSMTGCRNRELCPAYTDSEPVTQQVAEELV